jgi:hypothetical protein
VNGMGCNADSIELVTSSRVGRGIFRSEMSLRSEVSERGAEV